MRNSPESNRLDVSESVESPGEKEKIRADAFGSEYKPDYDFGKFFSRFDYLFIKKHFKNDYEIVLYMPNRQKIKELLSLIQANNYRIDIKFLESLTDTQKEILSSIFLEKLGKKIEDKSEMGKAILVWMLRYGLSDDGSFISKKSRFNYLISKISENFEGFDLDSFMLSYNFLEYTLGKSISLFDVISQYNVIKNLDKDLKDSQINDKSISDEGYGFQPLYAEAFSEVGDANGIGHGGEKNWGFCDIDSDGNIINISNEGQKIMKDEQGNDTPGMTLDRDNPLSYKNASGKRYEVYLDSPAGIGLFNNGEPVAYISFYIKNGDELFINQIQKVAFDEYDRYGRKVNRKYPKISENFNWEYVLYQKLIEIAKKHGISKITIQGGKNNIWTTKKWHTEYVGTLYYQYITGYRSLNTGNGEGKSHLSKETAEKIYDIFAEELGFQKDESDGNRKKEI